MNHRPCPEDWLVLPVEIASFEIEPEGFFDGKPTIDVGERALPETTWAAGWMLIALSSIHPTISSIFTASAMATISRALSSPDFPSLRLITSAAFARTTQTASPRAKTLSSVAIGTDTNGLFG